MLEYAHNLKNTMTLAKSGYCKLTKEEWEELTALKEAINYNPSTVTPDKMEKFTELFVRSLEERGGYQSVDVV